MEDALRPSVGQVQLQWLRFRQGVTLGRTLTRRPGVVERCRQIEGIGEVRLSAIAGTVGPTGPNWLSFLAVAGLPDPCPRPLDGLTDSLRTYFASHLGHHGDELRLGRVDGAWCPGFSDLQIRGRKLAGMGMRVRRGRGVIRGVIAVSPPGAPELARLDACHRLFGPGVDASKLVSLAELADLGIRDQEGAVRTLGAGLRR